MHVCVRLCVLSLLLLWWTWVRWSHYQLQLIGRIRPVSRNDLLRVERDVKNLAGADTWSLFSVVDAAAAGGLLVAHVTSAALRRRTPGPPPPPRHVINCSAPRIETKPRRPAAWYRWIGPALGGAGLMARFVPVLFYSTSHSDRHPLCRSDVSAPPPARAGEGIRWLPAGHWNIDD